MFVLFCFLLFSLSCVSIYVHAAPPGNYTNCQPIGPMFLSWEIVGPNIRLALEGRVGLYGWVAIGISPSGTMGGVGGADFMVGYVAMDGSTRLRDMWRASQTGNGEPMDDTNATDISNVAIQVIGGYLTVQFQRPLAADNIEDQSFLTTGTTPMIWALNSDGGAPETALAQFSQHTDKGMLDVAFNVAGNPVCTYPPPAPPPPPGGQTTATSPALWLAPTAGLLVALLSALLGLFA